MLNQFKFVNKPARPARKGKPHIYNPDRGIPFNGSYASTRKGKPDTDMPFDGTASATLNPNRGEDITDIHPYKDGTYYLSFKAEKQQTVAEWKKTLQEKQDIHLKESGVLAIAFSDESSLNKTLDLMVENKFIETNFFAPPIDSKRRLR